MILLLVEHADGRLDRLSLEALTLARRVGSALDQPVEAVLIGEGAKIGAGSIVIKDVPANSTVVGNPGRAVVVDGQRVDPETLHHPTLEHTRLPDPVAEAMACLVRRVTELEEDLADLRAGREPRKRGKDGDCLPTVQEEIAGILGLNGGSGI